MVKIWWVTNTSGPATIGSSFVDYRFNNFSIRRRDMTVQGYVSVNGLQMYYEIRGEGQPLILLHGAFSAIGTSFGKLLPALSKTRQVIGFEMQAHGRTADIDRPLTLEGMADDVAEAIRQFGLGQADVLGYSMGAGVAM